MRIEQTLGGSLEPGAIQAQDGSRQLLKIIRRAAGQLALPEQFGGLGEGQGTALELGGECLLLMGKPECCSASNRPAFRWRN